MKAVDVVRLFKAGSKAQEYRVIGEVTRESPGFLLQDIELPFHVVRTPKIRRLHKRLKHLRMLKVPYRQGSEAHCCRSSTPSSSICHICSLPYVELPSLKLDLTHSYALPLFKGQLWEFHYSTLFVNTQKGFTRFSRRARDKSTGKLDSIQPNHR